MCLNCRLWSRICKSQSSRANSETFWRATWSARVQPRASQLNGERSTAQMDNNPKEVLKAQTQNLSRESVITRPKSDWARVSLPGGKPERRMSQKPKTSCSIDLAGGHRGPKRCFGIQLEEPLSREFIFLESLDVYPKRGRRRLALMRSSRCWSRGLLAWALWDGENGANIDHVDGTAPRPLAGWRIQKMNTTDIAHF